MVEKTILDSQKMIKQTERHAFIKTASNFGNSSKGYGILSRYCSNRAHPTQAARMVVVTRVDLAMGIDLVARGGGLHLDQYN